jgi:hypothetical protein
MDASRLLSILAPAILGGMAAYDGGQPNAKLTSPQVLSSKPSGAVSEAKAKGDIPAPGLIGFREGLR